MNIIQIVLGDWSNDGHGKTETFVIESNLTQQEILDAYKAASKKIGKDLTSLCEDYEDSGISQENAQEFIKAGISFDKVEKYDNKDKNSKYSLWADSYFDLWTQIVKLGNPKFQFAEVKGKEIHIGGYGLFH